MTAKELGQCPAFPVPPDTISPTGEVIYCPATGLTKHEHIAVEIAKSLIIANSSEQHRGLDYCSYMSGFRGDEAAFDKFIMNRSCELTNALLEQLAKDQP